MPWSTIDRWTPDTATTRCAVNGPITATDELAPIPVIPRFRQSALGAGAAVIGRFLMFDTLNKHPNGGGS